MFNLFKCKENVDEHKEINARIKDLQISVKRLECEHCNPHYSKGKEYHGFNKTTGESIYKEAFFKTCNACGLDKKISKEVYTKGLERLLQELKDEEKGK